MMCVLQCRIVGCYLVCSKHWVCLTLWWWHALHHGSASAPLYFVDARSRCNISIGKGVEFYNPACRGGREKRRNMFHHNVSLLPPCTTHQSRGLTDAPLACFCAELWSFKLFAYRRAHIYTLKYIDKKQKQTVLALPFPSTFLSYP